MFMTHKLRLPDTAEGRVRAAEMLLHNYVPELCAKLRMLDGPQWVFSILTVQQVAEEQSLHGTGVVPPCDGMAILCRADEEMRQVTVTVRGDLVGIAVGDYLPADKGGVPGVAALSLITHGLAANVDYAANLICGFRETQGRLHEQFGMLYPAGTITVPPDTDLATVIVQGQG